MSTLPVVDLLLVAIVVLTALTGFRQGLVVGLFGAAGLLAGVSAGLFLAPLAVGRTPNATVWVTLSALGVVVMLGFLGQGIAQFLGGQVRDRLTWKPARLADAIGGIGFSGATALALVWLLSGALTGTALSTTANSKVLDSVSTALPVDSARAFDTLDDTAFTNRYIDPFLPERTVPVPAPTASVVTDADVVAAGSSVLKIRGAKSCGGASEGTGFVFAENRLMTNAHVVEDMARPEVLIGTSVVPATVIAYSEDLDLAVLAFDDRNRVPLEFDFSARTLDDVAVAGFPEDGPYDVQAGRVRTETSMRGPAADGSGTRVREVLTVRALVRQGNSGGPVLDTDGKVVAVVFATDTTKGAETGYAVTAESAARFGAESMTATKAIDTSLC